MSSSSRRTKPTSSSSVSTRPGRRCACDARMTSYYCKNGPNKGRLFWRCLFWQGDETCNLFIWDDDIAQRTGVHEMSDHESKMKEVSISLETMRELYEISQKKNKKLKVKIKSDVVYGKMKTWCIVVSVIVNLYFLWKCNC